MTRPTWIRRVGLTAAVLAIGVLTLSAQAAPKERSPKKQGQPQRQAQNDSGRQRERSASSRQSGNERQARNNDRRARDDRQATQRVAQPRHESPTQVRSAAVSDRGDNWGVNAQRNNLDERQDKVRSQEQRIEQKRIEDRQDLREAKQKFDDKIQRQKQELLARDHRLDAKAQSLRHASHVGTLPQHSSHGHSTYSKPSYGHGAYKHDYYKHDSHHDDHGKLGIHFSFGNYHSTGFYYVDGYRRHHCCTGGYYTSRWVPPLIVTRYDDYGDPYTVVIREGYYHRVWVPHYCRFGLHVYHRY